jgi:hypothetical protein
VNNIEYPPNRQHKHPHPPYSREVIAARRAGEAVNVHIHVGPTAWDRAAKWAPGDRVVVPLDMDHSPSDFNFEFLEGLAVTLNALDADLVLARQVAVAAVEHGASLVVLLHPDLPKNSEYFYGAAS